jgi:mono/diheme cytochrome c family protein
MPVSKGIVFLALIVSLVITSCAYLKKDVVQAPCIIDSVISYRTQVAPIIQNNCAACHSSASNISGILLENYIELKFYADNGYLYGTISHGSGYIPMPDGAAKLDDCSIATIKKWIDTGVPDN